LYSRRNLNNGLKNSILYRNVVGYPGFKKLSMFIHLCDASDSTKLQEAQKRCVTFNILFTLMPANVLQKEKFHRFESLNDCDFFIVLVDSVQASSILLPASSLSKILEYPRHEILKLKPPLGREFQHDEPTPGTINSRRL